MLFGVSEADGYALAGGAQRAAIVDRALERVTALLDWRFPVAPVGPESIKQYFTDWAEELRQTCAKQA